MYLDINYTRSHLLLITIKSATGWTWSHVSHELQSKRDQSRVGIFYINWMFRWPNKSLIKEKQSGFVDAIRKCVDFSILSIVVFTALNLSCVGGTGTQLINSTANDEVDDVSICIYTDIGVVEVSQ